MLTTMPVAPVWLRGLANATFGIYAGFIAMALPQLLAERRVPELAIANLTAFVSAPGFFAFMLSPILDLKFTRRFYSVFLAITSATMLAIAVLQLEHLGIIQGCLTVGFTSAILFQSALAGWLLSGTTKAERHTLSAWMSIGTFSGGSVSVLFSQRIITTFPRPFASAVLALLVISPIILFMFIPSRGDCVGPSVKARASLWHIPRALGDVSVWRAAIVFLLPAGTFGLTNIIAAFGKDFKSSEQFISNVDAASILIGGIAGGTLFPIIVRRISPSAFYLLVAIIGNLFTFTIALLPRTPIAFAALAFGENLFQSFAIITGTAIVFNVIGPNNPLAATTYSLLLAIWTLPLSYMQLIDGHVYANYGLTGSLIADSICGIAAAGLVFLILSRGSLDRTVPSR